MARMKLSGRSPGCRPGSCPGSCLRAGALAAGSLVLLLVLPALSDWLPLTGASALSAQVTSRGDVLDEVRSLVPRVEISGGGAGLARDLEAVLLQELERTGILRELGPPRQGDCCVLRMDVRLATPRGVLRLGTGYTMRLDLGLHDRIGRLDAWVLLWQSRTLDGVVDARELPETLRLQARELAVEFTEQYRERFPPRF